MSTELLDRTEDEPVADRACGGEAPRRRRPSLPTGAARALWLPVALVLVATVALAATGGRAWLDARRLDQARSEALAAGRQLAVNFATLDARTVDADTDRVKAGATGEFLASYTRSLADLRSLVVENKSSSRVERAEAALVSGDLDSAQVIVGVVAPTRNAVAPQGEKKTYRIKLGLREVGGTWKVERLEFVG
jgi:Mce-associated membrane protein